MDILSAVGFVLALVAVLVGAVLKGAGIHALLSAAAFMIVVVGTIAAIFIQTPLAVFKHAMSRFSWVIKPPPMQAEELIKKIVEWSTIARKQGLLGLEPLIEQEAGPVREARPAAGGRRRRAGRHSRDPRSGSGRARARGHARRQGVRRHGHLLADARHHRRRARPHGRHAEPRRSLEARPGHRGGIHRDRVRHRLANLFFLPVAGKLKGIVAEQTQVREMVIEGMVSIVLGENPRAIESKLHGYLH